MEEFDLKKEAALRALQGLCANSTILDELDDYNLAKTAINIGEIFANEYKKELKIEPGKWYSMDVIPDVSYNLIAKTDMGFIFEAVYESGMWQIARVDNGKVYFETYYNFVQWMKV